MREGKVLVNFLKIGAYKKKASLRSIANRHVYKINWPDTKIM